MPKPSGMESLSILCRQWGLSLEGLLYSKKNRVYKARCGGCLCILKWFRPQGEADWEFSILTKAHGQRLRVPRPLNLWPGRAILMEYIPGENLCDLLNERPSPKLARSLAEWYAAFHRAFTQADGKVLLKGDSILRNFIWQPESLWGIDFEESRPGDPAEDIGEITCSILSTDPMFTREKILLCRFLIDHYQRLAPLEGVEDALAQALVDTARRRGADCLLPKARLIKEKGLDSLSAEDES